MLKTLPWGSSLTKLGLFWERFSTLPYLYGIISRIMFNYPQMWMNAPAVLVRTEDLAVTSSTDTTVLASQDSTDLTARQVKVCTFYNLQFFYISHKNKQWLKNTKMICVIYTYTRVYVDISPVGCRGYRHPSSVPAPSPLGAR